MTPNLSEDYGALYRPLHEANEKAFAGYSLKHHLAVIEELVWRLAPEKPDLRLRLLDYGSGKGYQYLQKRMHNAWGGILPYCYDPGVRQLAEMPEGSFRGIICTDVMEHIAEPDVDAVLDHIFDQLTDGRPGFVFFAICCAPAKKTLGDGRNAHLTVRPPEWWRQKIDDAAMRSQMHPEVVIAFDERDRG